MAGRTLVFNFDGTGNEPSDAREVHKDESLSNIAKLHVMLGGRFEKRPASVPTLAGTEQHVHYYSGIGTRGSNMLWKHINMIVAPSWADADDILEEAHDQFEALKYTPEDKIVLFGFSRGAALARKFASQLLEKHRDCRVSFLGVFDTVAAMDGIHFGKDNLCTDVYFKNKTLSERVERAVHLVSLDEDLIVFPPTLINRDDSNPDRILEVWFPGVHSDVGGGYWSDCLSDLALEFMIRECRDTLEDHILIRDTADKIRALIPELPEDLNLDDVHLDPKVDGELHKSSWMAALAREARRIQTCRENVTSKRPEDLPLLHQSVKERFDLVAGYRPRALSGQRFKLLLRDGTRTEPLEGLEGLHDYTLPAKPAEDVPPDVPRRDVSPEDMSAEDASTEDAPVEDAPADTAPPTVDGGNGLACEAPPFRRPPRQRSETMTLPRYAFVLSLLLVLLSAPGCTGKTAGSPLFESILSRASCPDASELHDVKNELRDGKKHGYWVECHGLEGWGEYSREEGTYVDGKRHGYWVETGGFSFIFLTEPSSYWKEGLYVDGRKYGRWTEAIGCFCAGAGTWEVLYVDGIEQDRQPMEER